MKVLSNAWCDPGYSLTQCIHVFPTVYLYRWENFSGCLQSDHYVKKVNQITNPKYFNLKWMVSNLVRIFDDEDKLKIPYEIFSPLNPWKNTSFRSSSTLIGWYETDQSPEVSANFFRIWGCKRFWRKTSSSPVG